MAFFRLKIINAIDRAVVINPLSIFFPLFFPSVSSFFFLCNVNEHTTLLASAILWREKKGIEKGHGNWTTRHCRIYFVEESQLVFSLGAWLAVKSLTGFLFEPRPHRGDLYARTCPFIMHVPCACQRVRWRRWLENLDWKMTLSPLPRFVDDFQSMYRDNGREIFALCSFLFVKYGCCVHAINASQISDVIVEECDV